MLSITIPSGNSCWFTCLLMSLIYHVLPQPPWHYKVCYSKSYNDAEKYWPRNDSSYRNWLLGNVRDRNADRECHVRTNCEKDYRRHDHVLAYRFLREHLRYEVTWQDEDEKLEWFWRWSVLGDERVQFGKKLSKSVDPSLQFSVEPQKRRRFVLWYNSSPDYCFNEKVTGITTPLDSCCRCSLSSCCRHRIKNYEWCSSLSPKRRLTKSVVVLSWLVNKICIKGCSSLFLLIYLWLSMTIMKSTTLLMSLSRLNHMLHLLFDFLFRTVFDWTSFVVVLEQVIQV